MSETETSASGGCNDYREGEFLPKTSDIPKGLPVDNLEFNLYDSDFCPVGATESSQSFPSDTGQTDMSNSGGSDENLLMKASVGLLSSEHHISDVSDSSSQGELVELTLIQTNNGTVHSPQSYHEGFAVSCAILPALDDSPSKHFSEDASSETYDTSDARSLTPMDAYSQATLGKTHPEQVVPILNIKKSTILPMNPRVVLHQRNSSDTSGSCQKDSSPTVQSELYTENETEAGMDAIPSIKPYSLVTVNCESLGESILPPI